MLKNLNKYKDGEPCSHRGCLNHFTHPCEGCGRIAGMNQLKYRSKKNGLTYIIVRHALDATDNKFVDNTIYFCESMPDQWFIRTTEEFMIKFEEIILILEKVRKTKNYNRLDQSVIFSFIDEYVAKERQNLIDKVRIEEKKQQDEENKEQEAMIRQLYEDVKAGKRKLYNDELNELHRNEKRKIADIQASQSKKEAEYILWREQYNKEQAEKAFKTI